jgi:very-short-patch-repair endonuclease
MLIVELDGEAAHHSPAQLAADRRRQAWLESQGFTVIRFTHEEVAREPGRVAAAVRTHLA